jgi:hypothetical protein
LPINSFKQTKQKCSSTELQDLILKTLEAIPDAPTVGMTVTVYGYNPWNAATATAIRISLGRVVEQLRDKIEIEIPKD